MSTAADAFKSPDSFATTLLVATLDLLGTDCLVWLPDTIQQELLSETGVELEPMLLDRLMAAVAVLTSNRFTQNLPDFINLCNVLSGDSFDPTQFDPADAGECAWGITEASLICGEPLQFSYPIRRYLGEVVTDEGMLSPPDVLAAAIRTAPAWRNSVPAALHSTVMEVDKQKNKELTSMVREHLMLLFQQLESLELQNGDPSVLGYLRQQMAAG